MVKASKSNKTAIAAEPLALAEPTIPQKVTQKRSRRSKKIYFVIAALLLLIAAGSAFGLLQYNKVVKENQRLSDPQESAKAESDRTKREVASILEVPTDEEPTIATVKDPAQLQKQPFYTKAVKGDRVLFYAKAKKAILYRPDTKKIIEVATLNISSNQTQPAAPGATTNSANTAKPEDLPAFQQRQETP